MANITVAGVKKKLIKFPPLLYVSRLIFSNLIIIITNTIAIIIGLNNGNLVFLYTIQPISKAINEIITEKIGELIMALT